jgi:hypothetical protein
MDRISWAALGLYAWVRLDRVLCDSLIVMMIGILSDRTSCTGRTKFQVPSVR